MEIKVINKELKDVWDIQRATLVLRMCGLSPDAVNDLSNDDRLRFEKEITSYLWVKIQEQFPKIKEFTHGKTGGFNKSDERNHNTPIICIHGNFYLQLIKLNDMNNWAWESIDLEPYRFEFNEEGYFKNLIVAGINKVIFSGSASKDTFKDLINSLNETPSEESILTIVTKGKDLGKVDLHKVKTQIN